MLMRFVQHSEGEGPQCLTMQQMPQPSISKDQVLIKVAAFGINRADTLQRQGKYPPPKGESSILGLEVAGHIAAVGENARGWQEGEAVFGLVSGGGYGEWVAVNPSHLMPVPDGVSMTDAAAIAEVFLTAFQSLFLLGELQAGQSVLLHAGASGVGLAATQLAKASNCQVAVTASSDEKLQRCGAMGADILINYTEQDFASVLSQHKQRCDVIVDVVGGDYLNRNLQVLNTDGRIIYLAMLAGRYADTLDLGLLLSKRARIQGSTLRNRSDFYKAELVEAFRERFYAGIASGRLQANVEQVFDATDIGEAHARLESNQSMGKLVGRW